MTPTCNPAQTRAANIGILIGYATLGSVYFATHDTPGEAFVALLPFMVIGIVGTTLAISASRASLAGRSFLGLASRPANWLGMAGYFASGFFLGVLLYRVTTLFT